MTPYLFENAVVPSVCMVKWTRRMRISIYRPAKLARNWSYMVAPVRHFGYFWWRHRFRMASFSPSTLDSSVFKKHRFQIAPLWRAFSIGSVFGDRFPRCSVDDSRIRSKTAPFSFENGLVWSGPEWKLSSLLVERLFVYGVMDIGTTLVITYKKIIGEYIGLTSANIKLMIWWTFWNRAQYTGWTFHYVKKIH